MERDESDRPRRWFLRATGAASMAGAAGCFGDDGADGDDGEDGDDEDSQACLDKLEDTVPEIYETAESIDGIERDPNELNTREEAAYQCYPSGYQLCANCRFFIPAKPTEADTGDAGACAIVEGLVRSRDWCALYQPNNNLESFPSPVALDESGQQKAPDVTLNESDAN